MNNKKFLFKVFRAMNKYTESAQLKDPHYIFKVSEFKSTAFEKGGVVFLGDSITEQGNWSAIKFSVPVYNFGISGDTSYGVLKRVGQVISINPVMVILTIGVNDLQRGFMPEKVSANTGEIVKKLYDGGVQRVFIQTVLPVIEEKLMSGIKNHTINELNRLNNLIMLNAESGWLNARDVFVDENGSLRKEFTDDGLHVNTSGYQAWYEYLNSFLPLL